MSQAGCGRSRSPRSRRGLGIAESCLRNSMARAGIDEGKREGVVPASAPACTPDLSRADDSCDLITGWRSESVRPRSAERTSSGGRGPAARAGGPELAAAADGGGINAVMGLDDPADPGGDGDAVEIGGPLPAAPIELARSGSAQDEPCAGPEAAGEQEPGAGQGGVAAAAGRPPKAAGQESEDEPFVSGDDDEGLPAARVAAGGATADPVKDYLKQIGKAPLLNAGQEVELAKRIEAGLFADHKLADGSGVLRPGQSIDL